VCNGDVDAVRTVTALTLAACAGDDDTVAVIVAGLDGPAARAVVTEFTAVIGRAYTRAAARAAEEWLRAAGT